MISRRRFLQVGGGTAGSRGAGCRRAVAGRRRCTYRTMLRQRGAHPRCLAAGVIPRVLQPEHVEPMDRYEITSAPPRSRSCPASPPPCGGTTAAFRPTIQARRGRPVVVRHHNTLPVPTVGGTTWRAYTAASDGYPTDHRCRRFLSTTGHARPTGPDVSVARDYAIRWTSGRHALVSRHRMDFTGPSIWRGSSWLFPHWRRRGRRAAAPPRDATFH